MPDILTGRQYNEFAEYFDWRDNRRGKADFYGAQLAGIMSGRKRWRLKDFMAPSPDDDSGRYVMSAKDAARILKRTAARKPKRTPKDTPKEPDEWQG